MQKGNPNGFPFLVLVQLEKVRMLRIYVTEDKLLRS